MTPHAGPSAVQWPLLAIATVVAVELVLRLNLAGRIRRLLAVVRKVLRTLRSDRISDHWKARAALAYSGQMFAASLTLLAVFLLALAPFAVLAAMGTWTGIPFPAVLMDARRILVCVAIACAYVPLRRRFRHV